MNRLEQILGFIPTVFIDDGHGENTAGKRTPTFADGTVIKENQFNKPTAYKLGEKLTVLGFEVVYVATESEDVPLKTRTDRANAVYEVLKKRYPNIPKEQLGIYISIHFNAEDDTWGGTMGGVDTFFYPGSKLGEMLAALLLKHLIEGTPQRNRGINAANFHVLRETNMPAALAECGFMDYEIEAGLMLDEAFQNEVATELMKGICDYYKVKEVVESFETEAKLAKYKNTIEQIKKLIEGI